MPIGTPSEAAPAVCSNDAVHCLHSEHRCSHREPGALCPEISSNFPSSACPHPAVRSAASNATLPSSKRQPYLRNSALLQLQREGQAPSRRAASGTPSCPCTYRPTRQSASHGVFSGRPAQVVQAASGAVAAAVCSRCECSATLIIVSRGKIRGDHLELGGLHEGRTERSQLLNVREPAIAVKSHFSRVNIGSSSAGPAIFDCMLKLAPWPVIEGTANDGRLQVLGELCDRRAGKDIGRIRCDHKSFLSFHKSTRRLWWSKSKATHWPNERKAQGSQRWRGGCSSQSAGHGEEETWLVQRNGVGHRGLGHHHSWPHDAPDDPRPSGKHSHRVPSGFIRHGVCPPMVRPFALLFPGEIRVLF